MSMLLLQLIQKTINVRKPVHKGVTRQIPFYIPAVICLASNTPTIRTYGTHSMAACVKRGGYCI